MSTTTDKFPDPELKLTDPERMRIYERDGGVCQLEGCPCHDYYAIHHIIPLSTKKHNDPYLLILVCGKCHIKIHSKGWMKFKAYLLERAKLHEDNFDAKF